MKKIELYDEVILIDGRKAAIVEILTVRMWQIWESVTENMKLVLFIRNRLRTKLNSKAGDK